MTTLAARFFGEVSPSSYLGQTEGLAGSSNPMYLVCDSKSEKSAPSKGSLYVKEHLPGLWD